MRPAIRSTFDIVAWYKSRAAADEAVLMPSALIKMLYLSQAIFAGENNGVKMMPATFLATDVGPIEPDLFLSLDYVNLEDPVAPADNVEDVLLAVWGLLLEEEEEGLDRLLAVDSAMRSAKERARNSEILIDEMVAAYPAGLATLSDKGSVNRFPDGSSYKTQHPSLDAAPTEDQKVRFTADGRSVTRWAPKRRIKTKK
ncbi:MAG: hypothetical protein JJ879_08015 [Sneathiella sp.]|nr:hypothetical protein [Sneathiella sp.]